MQTIDGYTHYEIGQYIKELYFITFPQVMGFALLAMFVQTLVSNKFLGHGIVIGVFVLQPILFNFGWENTLYLPGTVPAYIYSDMNGYGHFVPAIVWSIVYWFCLFAFLGVISIAFAHRGTEEGLRQRSRMALRRAPTLALPAAVLALLAAGAGGWFFYNGHVLNEYLNSKDRRDIQADYERRYAQYEALPQPKVTAVDAQIDIHPERRGFEGHGTFTLQNKSGSPLSQVHVTDAHESVTALSFDRPYHLVSRAPRDHYSIYQFEQPLGPGEVVKLEFSIHHVSSGFRDGTEPAQFARNGTFFDTEFLPLIGYDVNTEIDDPRRRREEHLGELRNLAVRGSPMPPDKICSRPIPIGSRIGQWSAPPTIRLRSLPATLSESGTRPDGITSSTAWDRRMFSISFRTSRPATWFAKRCTRAHKGRSTWRSTTIRSMPSAPFSSSSIASWNSRATASLRSLFRTRCRSRKHRLHHPRAEAHGSGPDGVRDRA